MLSSITSMLWGGAEPAPEENDAALSAPPTLAADENGVVDNNEPKQRTARRDASPDDWVMVGPNPAPGSLSGDLSPLVLSNRSSPDSSASSSSASSEDSANVAAAPRPVARGHNHGGAAAGALSAVQSDAGKLSRAAQAGRTKAAGKALSAKSLKRANKAVTCAQYANASQKKASARHSMAIKMAGANKNLKQC